MTESEDESKNGFSDTIVNREHIKQEEAEASSATIYGKLEATMRTLGTN
jgi:hypothetical protein